MTDNEKLVELYARFAKEKDIQKLMQITGEIASVLAAKEQRVRQLQGEIGSALGPRIAREGMEHERPSFGGEPGEPVPQVDPEDVKALWGVSMEVQRAHPGEPVGIDVSVFEHACKPGANVQAVYYRTAKLEMLRHVAPQLLEPWTKKDQLDDAVFRAVAQVPMEWVGVGIVHKGLAFDIEDFMRRVREAA